MYKCYKIAIDIQTTSTANAYATIVMEKVDEKSFDDIDDNFINLLTTSGEFEYDSTKYTIEFSADNIENEKYIDNGVYMFKEARVTVSSIGNAKVDGKQIITLRKIKVNEKELVK